jgi:ribosomal protein S18 acetylase RimI-like enzyme
MDADLPQAAEDGNEIYAHHIRQQILNPYTHVLVAEDQGEVIGYVLGLIVHDSPDMFQHDPSGFLADIFIQEAYRGCGIGRQLVNALQAWFKSRGVSYMEWYVAAQNEPAKAFWMAIGGREIMIRMQVKL